MPNLTTNFSFNKPLVNDPTDEDLWGGYLNDNWDSIDATVPWTTSAETADFNVLSTEFNYLYVVDTSGGAVTANLPTGVFGGFKVAFNVSDNSNTFTLDPNGSETIDGASTLVVSTSVIAVYDGTSNWVTIGNAAAASETQAGVIELATTAEAQALSDATKAITPSTLGDVTATTTRTGLVEKATAAEVAAQTADKFPDSADLKSHPGISKGGGNVTASGATGSKSIANKHGVLNTVNKTATGTFAVSLSPSMGNASYNALISPEVSSGNGMTYRITSKTTSGFTVTFRLNTATPSNVDPDNFGLEIFGAL